MKKQILPFLILICLAIVLVISLPKENKIKEYNNEETNSIPLKDSGYYYDREKSSCTNGAYINWDSISWSPVVQNMNEYKTRCELHFTTTYTEGILNGTDPVLEDPLIPVTIEADGTVKRADLTTPWYSYADKEWANAVITQNSYDALTNSGEVHGAIKNEGYVSFDGVDDYIDLGLENYDFGNQITFIARVKINASSTGEWHKIICNQESAGFAIDYYQNNQLLVSLWLENENAYTSLAFSYETNTWYTIVGMYNGNTFKLYVNGELISEKESIGKIKSSSMPVVLGANPEANSNFSEYANMDVEQVAIYNRALSEEEIKESVSESIKIVDDTGLLRYADFTNKTYEENEIIPESVIESYFVWIPKYRYQLWDLGLYESLTSIDENKVHEIPIIFGDYNTSDDVSSECTTPMTSGASGNCTVGDYMTHPAFLSIPSTGFWVGKFETGYAGAINKIEAEQNMRDASKIVVKPNAYSWRGIQVSNAFYTSYDYKRDLDSHMMKNTEWGAVAYLQHSAFGSAKSVRINNNSSFITGYAANNEPTCDSTGANEECNNYCNDETCNMAYPDSILASTTGNISGIYDMSGGAYDYTMGVMVDQNNELISGRNSSFHSNFKGIYSEGGSNTSGFDWPDKKYYDIYTYATVDEQYQRRILGDATGEMGPFSSVTYLTQTRYISSWYTDYSKFLFNIEPFFLRGESYANGMEAGIFAFDQYFGDLHDMDSFRIILTPTGGTT